jgi:hypothetical protein
MTELATNVAELEETISRKKGSFNLFALFEREELPNRWDLVVAAPWADDLGETLRYFAGELNARLEPRQMLEIARIVVLDPNGEAVQAINRAYDVEHGRLEIHNADRFGLPVRQGLIFTSKKAA